MFIGKVSGNVVASQKSEKVSGFKLMLIEPYSIGPGAKPDLKPTGRVVVAVDTVGAGEGEMVLITQGSSARLTEMTAKTPVDAVIVAIVDTVTASGATIYQDRQP